MSRIWISLEQMKDHHFFFFFCKGPESKYFVLCGPLVVSVVALQLFHFSTKAAREEQANEWTELCSIKTLQKKTAGQVLNAACGSLTPGLDHGEGHCKKEA